MKTDTNYRSDYYSSFQNRGAVDGMATTASYGPSRARAVSRVDYSRRQIGYRAHSTSAPKQSRHSYDMNESGSFVITPDQGLDQDSSVGLPQSIQQKEPTIREKKTEIGSASQSPDKDFARTWRAATSQTLKNVPIDNEFELPKFSLPLYESADARQLVVGKRKLRKLMMRMSAGFAAVLLLGGGIFTWRGLSAGADVFGGTSTVAALSSVKITPEALKGEGDGRVNILLLGVGGGNHDGADLTDTMLIASVDPVNKKVALLSLPRDLWVKMPNNYYGDYQKINAAYSAGKYKHLGKIDSSNSNRESLEAGFAAVDSVVEQVTGKRIDYHVLVNFAGFEKAVDTVDGVEMNIKEPLVDATMAWENNNNPVLAGKGRQQMDGKQALMYARSRYTSSDFDRSERQRQLIIALKQKVLTLGTFANPVKVDGLARTLGENVYTDLSTTAALRLYDITKNIKDGEMRSLDLVTPPNDLVEPGTVNGDISIVKPKIGIGSYSEIQSYVKSQLRDGYLVRENAPMLVLAQSASLQEEHGKAMRDYGYNVTGARVFGPEIKASAGVTVYDLSNGKSPFTSSYLQKRFGDVKTSLPDNVTVPTDTQFVILVGA